MSKDLINRQAAIEAIKTIIENPPYHDSKGSGYFYTHDIYQAINDVPSIDIVQCNECKYGQDDLFHMFCTYH